ncbi:hypothetical protein [Staphylospora marina]|uniref:hypothetical protein n=1 Tax=Staphylospora marina TaxID=2490858 RepID=UPI000F5C1563|nr:hypothetical protein [Staphylospora marina]
MRNMFRWMVVGCLLLTGCADGGSPEAQGPKETETREQWTVSPVFETASGSKVRGEKNRAGILVHEENGLVVTQEIAKYMWLVWGDPEQLKKGATAEIYGMHREDGKRQLLHKASLNGPMHGADAMTLSGPTFPKKGLWKIEVVVDGESHATFVLDVK